MSEGSWSDAVRLTQRSLRSTPIKRIYTAVDIAEGEGGWSLLLDGRAARTPAKAKLIAPNRAIAEVIAAEWAGQGETLDTVAMPMTRLANSAIDGVANTMAQTRADIAAYANSDLTCYRALEPEALAALQAAAFDPVLDWAHEALGARFLLSGSLMHVPQPAPALAAAREAVEAFESPFAVAALHGMTSLTGSVLIALAVARGALDAEAAWRAAHVDEDYQIGKWGEDDEAMARRAARWIEFSVAATVIAS
jgi:chaperone required for assembly of F1-ATPase